MTLWDKFISAVTSPDHPGTLMGFLDVYTNNDEITDGVMDGRIIMDCILL
jgi:hypothetical protein